MNRNFRLTTLAFASILALMPFASAQQSSPAQPGTRPSNTQPGQMPPGGQAMRATFELVRKVDALNRLGRTPNGTPGTATPSTTLSSAQASSLAALLTPLKTAKTLTPEQAKSISASIDRLLTPVQRTALAQAGNRMGGRMRGQPNQSMQGAPGQGSAAQGGPNGQMPGNPMPSNQAGGTANSQPGNGQLQGHRMPGGPQGMTPNGNPFLTGRGSQALNALLGQLQK